LSTLLGRSGWSVKLPANRDLKTKIRFKCRGSRADFTAGYFDLQTEQRKCPLFRFPHFLHTISFGSMRWICDLLLPCLAVEIFLLGVAAICVFYQETRPLAIFCAFCLFWRIRLRASDLAFRKSFLDQKYFNLV